MNPSNRKPHFVSFATLAILACACLGWAPQPVLAQYTDTFDSPTATWELGEFDSLGPDKTWQRVRAKDLQRGNGFERLYFNTGNGTKILAANNIPACFVIPELKLSLKVKSSRPGVKLLARVVLPHTPAPDGEGPMKTTLVGDAYTQTDRWQTLSFSKHSNLAKQLEQDLWVLRRKYGGETSIRDAYVDKLILNLYSGPGETEVYVDDLTIRGIVSADQIAKAIEIGFQAKPQKVVEDDQPLFGKRLPSRTPVIAKLDPLIQPASHFQVNQDKKPSLVTKDGSVVLVKGKPFFPRVIQFNGESFNYLKSLGFNTIELPTAATKEQLASASELGIWLVCPAPPSAGLDPIGFEFDSVLAWSVGNRLTGRDLQNVQRTIREIKQSDLREGRPIVAGIESSWKSLGREADIVAIGMEPLGSSFIASQYSSWLRLRKENLGSRATIWGTVQTEFSKALTKQVQAISQHVPPTPLEPQQMKFLAYEALTGGSRGLRFASRSRLDATDPSSRLRAMTIKWLTTHIQQIEPWAAGGALMGELPLDDHHLEVTAFNTNRSRLLLIQRPTHHEQYWAGDTPIETVLFKDPNSTFTDRAMQIGEHGLIPLNNQRHHSGTVVRIDECPYTAAVVFTQDPLVFKSLNESYNRPGHESLLQLHLDISKQWVAILQLIDNQMGKMGRSSATSSGALNEAITNLRKAQELISSQTPAMSIPFLERTDERLAFTRRELVTVPLGEFKSKTSTPFLTHSSLVPLHWQLSGKLAKGNWNPNGLPGGDFENLNHMTSNGWQNKRFPNPLLKTSVELTEDAMVEGNYGLKLKVAPTGAMPPLVQRPPLWVKTAPVNVRKGQFVRIHGWVNVPKVILGSQNGLMIEDSIGGKALAERVPITKGWQEFTLYRAVGENSTLEVTLTMTGVGEAMIDEVTIRTVDLPAPARQAQLDQ